jgi:hypothetical protein
MDRESGEVSMKDELQKLHDWLSNEAEERMKAAMGSKSTAACLKGATASEFRGLAVKLESEARQLSAWADLVAGFIKK